MDGRNNVPCRIRDQWPNISTTKGMTTNLFWFQIAILWRWNIHQFLAPTKKQQANLRSDGQIDTSKTSGHVPAQLVGVCKRNITRVQWLYLLAWRYTMVDSWVVCGKKCQSRTYYENRGTSIHVQWRIQGKQALGEVRPTTSLNKEASENLQTNEGR